MKETNNRIVGLLGYEGLHCELCQLVVLLIVNFEAVFDKLEVALQEVDLCVAAESLQLK